MKYNTSKNKLDKIEKNQNDIDNSLFIKQNETKNLKSFPPVLKTNTILYDSDYQVFETNRPFGDLVSVSIDMPVVADDVAFTGSIDIAEEMIPYIRHSIITKKPIDGDIRGLYTANISTYNNDPETQVGLFEENTTIRNQAGDIIGNTGSGAGTTPKPNGDALVTKTAQPLFIVSGQRNIYSDNTMSSLQLIKGFNRSYDFTVSTQIMFIMPSDDNVGVSNLEGDRVYVATFVPSEPTNVSYYTLTDNRVSVSYPAYRPVEIDIEAKLVLYIPSNNIWENYSNHKS